MNNDQWKRAVKARDGDRCGVCGGRKDLHLHHIVPRAERPDLAADVDNGVTLCARHHAAAHRRIGDLVLAALRGGLAGGRAGGLAGGQAGGLATTMKYGGWAGMTPEKRACAVRVAHTAKDIITGKSLHAMRIGRASWAGLTPEQRGARLRASWDKSTMEQRLARMRPARQARWAGLTLEQRSGQGQAGGQVGTHNRWHVARGIANPACLLCWEGGG